MPQIEVEIQHSLSKWNDLRLTGRPYLPKVRVTHLSIWRIGNKVMLHLALWQQW